MAAFCLVSLRGARAGRRTQEAKGGRWVPKMGGRPGGRVVGGSIQPGRVAPMTPSLAFAEALLRGAWRVGDLGLPISAAEGGRSISGCKAPDVWVRQPGATSGWVAKRQVTRTAQGGEMARTKRDKRAEDRGVRKAKKSRMNFATEIEKKGAGSAVLFVMLERARDAKGKLVYTWKGKMRWAGASAARDLCNSGL